MGRERTLIFFNVFLKFIKKTNKTFVSLSTPPSPTRPDDQPHAHTAHRPPQRRRPFLLLLPLTSSTPEVQSHPLTPLNIASPCIVRFVVVASPSHRRLLALSSSRVHRSGSLSHEADLSSSFCRSRSCQPPSRSRFLGFSQPTSPSRSAVLAAHVTSPSSLVNGAAELSPIYAGCCNLKVHHQLQIPLKCDLTFC
ncbi:hypothetical protein PIB30_040536 [Stylosanthes scabra]|uniref:Uncharacterized protein n=1 Tax=Stylosanthes scabra TaxID=79078 RepID=A0ABU6TEE1_9FABA|nr:hypothetical protein [Stylosanthes scabra]